MNNKSLCGWPVRCIAAALLAFPSMVLAQGQIDTGRANDASNRYGSGGRNMPGMSYNYYSNNIVNNGNRIVSGNVTMGREFHDNIGSVDPYSFRGNMPSAALDSFYKNTAGVPQPYSREAPPNVSTPFYGASTTVQPPPGFVYNSARGGYVPPPPTGARGLFDQRLGIVDLNQPIAPVPIEGQLVTRGSLTPGAEGAGGIITANMLYGFRQWNPQDPADQVFLENLLNRQNPAFDRMHLDPKKLQRMRDELNRILEKEQPGVTKTPNTLMPNPFGRTFDSPTDPSLSGKPINDQLASNALNAQGAATGAGIRYNVMGVTAARRSSPQYAEMTKRLEQYYADRQKTDADFAREFNAALKAKAEAEKKKLAGNKAGNEVTPNIPKTPDKTTVDNTAVKPKKKPQPMKVATLSAGVKAEGLSSLLTKAEGLMKEGKFASAMDQYDAAAEVSPNNPLIWLGKANAELGAGFFTRADAHLRQAFMTDKALLMGQYDLTGMLGEDRLTKLVAELKDIATKDTKAMPVFLLAYISYNSGHERQAAGYLDLAEKRAEGKDLFLKMVKEHWALPDEEGTKPDTKTPEKKTEKPGPKPEKPATPEQNK